MKRKSKYYENVEVETLDDVCEVVYHNTDYMYKRYKKLNRKVNNLAFIFGSVLIGSLYMLAEEVQNLKIKCK